MMITREQIKAIIDGPSTRENYLNGLEAFNKVGRKLPALRKYLLQKAVKPDHAAWEKLKYELGLAIKFLPIVPANTGKKRKPGRPKKESFSSMPIPESIDELTFRIRKAAQARDRLSNMLTDPGDDAGEIKKNIEILEKQAIINQELKDLEARKAARAQGKKQDEPAGLTIQKGALEIREQEINEMSDDELNELYLSVKKDFYNYTNRAKPGTNKRESTRLKNEKKAELKRLEIAFLEKKIAERKYERAK